MKLLAILIAISVWTWVTHDLSYDQGARNNMVKINNKWQQCNTILAGKKNEIEN